MLFLPTAILGAQLLVAVADEIPHINIESTCKSAQPLEPTDPSPYAGCMREETQARTQVQQQWSRFTDASRRECSEETDIGGYPSYVDLLTCLQMANNTFTPPANSPGGTGPGGTGASGTATRTPRWPRQPAKKPAQQ